MGTVINLAEYRAEREQEELDEAHDALRILTSDWELKVEMIYTQIPAYGV